MTNKLIKKYLMFLFIREMPIKTTRYHRNHVALAKIHLTCDPDYGSRYLLKRHENTCLQKDLRDSSEAKTRVSQKRQGSGEKHCGVGLQRSAASQEKTNVTHENTDDSPSIGSGKSITPKSAVVCVQFPDLLQQAKPELAW